MIAPTDARSGDNSGKFQVVICSDICLENQHVMHRLKVEAFFHLGVGGPQTVQDRYKQKRKGRRCM